MRYYLINIFTPTRSSLLATYTSFPNGQPDPGALNVILDAYVISMATPQSLATLQIWGIPLATIAQASNFNGCAIDVYAGFQSGLPLNNAAQAGLILTGTIFQSFGNWSGVNMTLDFVVNTAGALASEQSNLSIQWKAGTPLSQALATALSTAFPGVKQTIQISPSLVIAHDETGFYSSLPALAQNLKPLTQSLIGGNYPGVDIVVTPNGIRVFDGSTQGTPTQIAFQDLIGQPTWIGPGPAIIQFVCPMRADLHVGDFVTLPKGILGNSANPAGVPGAVVTTSASQPQARQQSQFSGTFQIQFVHHMGNFRAPDGMSWITVFNCVQQVAQIPAGNVSFDIISLTQ